MAGRLHDLGAYPGVVDPIDPADIVHGELVELLDPTASFVWLDAYEGILPGALAASEYRRERRPVWLPGEVPSMATKVPAWVYIYAQGISGAPHVTSGIWQPA